MKVVNTAYDISIAFQTQPEGNAVAIAYNDPAILPTNGAGVSLSVKYSRTRAVGDLLRDAFDEMLEGLEEDVCVYGTAYLGDKALMDCFVPTARLNLQPVMDANWAQHGGSDPRSVRMYLADKCARNAIDLLGKGEPGTDVPRAGQAVTNTKRTPGNNNKRKDPSKLQHLPGDYGLTEFVVPVRITGVLTERVMAETFGQARQEIRMRLQVENNLSSRRLDDIQINCQAPVMSLSPEQRATWPYWGYGWYDTDGVDWRQYDTDKGPQSIPDLAEESWPIPAYHDNEGNNEKGDSPMTYDCEQASAESPLIPEDQSVPDDRKTVIVTAGHTCEDIDVIMQIANRDDGALGAEIVEVMLNADGKHDHAASQIKKVYYLGHETVRRPEVPDGQSYKLEFVPITTADSLLYRLTEIMSREHVDLVVHSCTVTDYATHYSVRGDSLAEEIVKGVLDAVSEKQINHPEYREAAKKAVLSAMYDPAWKAHTDARISSYDPDRMIMLKLTPKIIGHIKQLSLKTMLVGFKTTEGVDKRTLFDSASNLRQRHDADYIVASDLSEIADGRHPAMIVGYDGIMERDAIFGYCDNKREIAERICQLAFGKPQILLPAPAQDDTLYQIIITNNCNTDVQVAGFSANKDQAWHIMVRSLIETMRDMHMPKDANPPDDLDLSCPCWSWESVDGCRHISVDADSAMASDTNGFCWNHKIVAVSRDAVLGAIQADAD